MSSYAVPLGNVASNSAETLNSVSSWHISIENISFVATSSPGTIYVVSKADVKSLTFPFNVLETLLIFSVVDPTSVTV